MRRHRFALSLRSLALAALLLVGGAEAQQAQFLALDGEGAASVVVDDRAGTAYITDGGSANQKGIPGARIADREVLDYLLTQDVRHLVITCTHPHRDHMGGLKTLIDQDEQLLRFDSISFVDNAESRGTAASSLYDLFRQRWGDRPGAPSAHYALARGSDAFATLEVPVADIRVRNFVYDPETIGTDAHDRTVIVEYELRSRQEQVRMVDFDDASSKLINAWAKRSPSPRAEVVVIPHHGSPYNDLSPVLQNAERYGVRDVIIPVNRNNRYLHPGPAVLRDLVERFGPDHVFVTDSAVGDNVEVTARGVTLESSEAHRLRLAEFILAQVDRNQTRARNLLEIVDAGSDRDLSLALDSRSPLTAEQLRLLEEAKVLDDNARRALRRTVAANEDLMATLRQVEGNDITRQASSRPRGVRGSGLLAEADSSIPHRSGQRGVESYTDMRGTDGRFDPSPSGGEGGGGGGGGGGRGGGREGGGSGSGRATGRGGGGSGSSFGLELGRVRPRWGGIILGNEPISEAVPPASLDIVLISAPDEEDELADYVVRLTLRDGTVADLTGFTATEIWAAYNFVQPTDGLRARHGGLAELQGNDAGLVGIVENHGTYWDFAVHPAIIDTYLARDAMRTDMLISAVRQSRLDVPAALVAAAGWQGLSYRTYQWYDERAQISADHGRIRIQAVEPPEDCLMRIRLINWQTPAWAENEETIEREARRRQSQAEREAAANGRAVDPESLEQEIVQAMLAALESMADDTTTSDMSLNRSMSTICGAFDALQSIDRLARLVATFNWFRIETGRALPSLPGDLEPVHAPVPANWSFDRVFPLKTASAALSSNDESDEEPAEPATDETVGVADVTEAGDDGDGLPLGVWLLAGFGLLVIGWVVLRKLA